METRYKNLMLGPKSLLTPACELDLVVIIISLKKILPSKTGDSHILKKYVTLYNHSFLQVWLKLKPLGTVFLSIFVA